MPELNPVCSEKFQSENPEFNVFKTDDDKRLVFGWASIIIKPNGEQLLDRQQDMIDPDDLEEAAYEYVLKFRDTGEEHIDSMRKKGKLVESCVFTEEKQRAMGIPAGTIPVGWWIGFKIDDYDAWTRIKNGTYRMFSIEGKANREPVKKSEQTPTGCGVIVVRDGKILTGTRIEGDKHGQICGPGGHIEAGENPQQAAVREAYEEFGIKCRDLRYLGNTPGGESAIFLCLDFSGTPKADEEEITSAKWLTPEEINECDQFKPFEQSLDMLADEISQRTIGKTFSEILKFNPFHDARGRFSSSKGFATYSANPKTKAGAMAISRSYAGGHGTTFNSHKESKGENINQNHAWLQGGPGAKQLAAQGALASQQPKNPPKPKKNYDRLGFADQDDADYHQLHSGRQYYQQQQLTSTQKKAASNYLEANPEPGSLYSHCQNLNMMMAKKQKLTGKYKQTHDGMMSAMHNIGYNVTLTRYDHPGMINSLLKAAGAGSDYKGMSISKLQKALIGQPVTENKFLSTSYNDFQRAPQSTKQVFDTRAVKINYKASAKTQAMMPGVGPGGDFGEMVLAPGQTGKIVGVRLTGQMVRRKGTQIYDQPRIEIDIEI